MVNKVEVNKRYKITKYSLKVQALEDNTFF